MEENSCSKGISARSSGIWFCSPLRIFGRNTIESAIWHDIQKEKELEEQKRKGQVSRKMSDRLQWGRERNQEYNMQQKKNKSKHRGIEL